MSELTPEPARVEKFAGGPVASRAPAVPRIAEPAGTGTGHPTSGAGPDHRLERLVFFSDAVFAISITLLIFDVRPPHLAEYATDRDWTRALLGMLPNFGAFLLSFLTIGAMWARHHAVMSLLNRFDTRLVWPNLLMLMSIAFLPFSTSLLSIASPSPVPYAFYAGTLLVASLLKAWCTVLALRPDLIAPEVPAARIKAERRRIWLMPAASLVTLILAFVVPGLNTLAMFLLHVGRRLPWFDEED